MTPKQEQGMVIGENEEARNAQFWAWVRATMKERHLSFRQIEIDRGLGNATLGRQARLNLQPNETAFDALSAAFDLPKRTLMEIAGVIELPSEMSDDQFRELFDKVKELTPEQVDLVMRYIDFTFGDHS